MNPDPKSDSRAKLPGLTIVYTGDGKGKTAAAFGLALRMIGRGWNVLMLQFIKGPIDSGERIAALRLAPDLVVRTLGTGYVCVSGEEPSESERISARNAWDEASREVLSGKWDAVILDEINILTSLGLVSVSSVLNLLKTRPQHVTVVLTGRNASAELVAVADIVTEMSLIRHVYGSGVADVEGIDR